MTIARVAVLDIGKTNVKLALVDPASGAEVELRRMPNRVRPGPPYPHFDTAGHWDFLCKALAELGARHRIDAISITTHGAAAALVDAEGALALPILDYEFDGPEALAAEYDALRPAFDETGSPRLGCGLNLGAQLFWQVRNFPEAAGRVRHVLTYPQYWACRLTGVAAVEPSSLGCHTDLWRPREGRFSSLVGRMGWEALMPPVRAATEVLGGLRPEVARATGLAPGTPVVCGIHDSNASLYPHLQRRRGAFSVVSTGTWVIAMAIGGRGTALDPARDTLINVSALGAPVPSARFMGGREYELMRPADAARPGEADRAALLAAGLHLLPAVEPGSGPFRGRAGGWTAPPANDAQRGLALSWYLAGMTATCLSMIGAAGPSLVEGPFAANADFLAMLASATGRPVEAIPGSVTGTSAGAARLAVPDAAAMAIEAPRVYRCEPRLAAHFADWSRRAEAEAPPQPGAPAPARG